MAEPHSRHNQKLVQQVLLDDPEFLREIVERILQQLLEAEITEHIGAAPYERTDNRKGSATVTNHGHSKPGWALWSLWSLRSSGMGVFPLPCSPATSETRRRWCSL